MLYGYSELIMDGTRMTLQLALCSLVLALLIGLVGAAAKLSSNRVLSGCFSGYTTLIRGVPDLVLMLLIFYGLQMVLNSLTETLGLDQIDIDRWRRGLLRWDLFTALISPKPSAVLIWRCRAVRLRRQWRLVLRR